MKKTKQIDAYYCDYCGKECEHTPELVLPVKEKNKDFMFIGHPDVPTIEKIVAKQRDICPECQNQIAKLVNLLHYADFAGSDMEKMVYVLLKKTKA